jgi:type II secretory pathway predicted ATPase ExeA
MERHPGLAAGSEHASAQDSAPIAGERRRRAFEQLRAALRDGCGPVLITGEPGAGKSWFAERLAAELPSTWAAATVDLASALGAVGLLRLIGHSLGVAGGGGVADARIRIRGALEDDAADGRRWLLVVDAAERGSPPVWEELESIVHHLGRPGGFAGLVVLGQAELLREFARRRLSAFASSVAFHLHLLPLDLDEARELLGIDDRASGAVESALEDLHRDARGNPGRMVRLVQSRPGLFSAAWGNSRAGTGSHPGAAATPPSFGLAVLNDPPEDAEPLESPLPATVDSAGAAYSPPPLLPSKPPIRAEEGLIEVGWDGDLESELDTAGDMAATAANTSDPDLAFHEELVEDRYAALQAWTEWTRNQPRPAASAGGVSPSESVEADTHGPSQPDVVLDDDASMPVDAPAGVAASDVRAEGQHEFAPYSQLFTRSRQSKQPGG